MLPTPPIIPPPPPEDLQPQQSSQPATVVRIIRPAPVGQPKK